MTSVFIRDRSEPVQRIMQLLAEGDGFQLATTADAADLWVTGTPESVTVERANGAAVGSARKPFDVPEYLRLLRQGEEAPQ